jgi:hypothetical protein
VGFKVGAKDGGRLGEAAVEVAEDMGRSSYFECIPQSQGCCTVLHRTFQANSNKHMTCKHTLGRAGLCGRLTDRELYK